MLSGLAFGSRVERSIVAAVLLAGLLPLTFVAIFAMREVQDETLKIAEKQLRDATKTYALDLLNHFERAVSEMRLAHHSGKADLAARYVEDVRFVERAPAAPRASLLRADGGFLLEVPEGDGVLTGRVKEAEVFKELGYVPYGVSRCVIVNGEPLACGGTPVAGEALSISTQWELPLGSVYDTELRLAVTSQQLESVAVEHVSLIVRLLPLAVLTIACGLGWYLLLRIRKVVAPLAALQQATRSVSDGDYDHRVDVRTGDEFERLGLAFNMMTARLGSSFQKMQALAEIDRLVLSGAGLEEVVRHALRLARAADADSCALYLADEGAESGTLFRLDNDALQEVPLRVPDGEAPAAALAKTLDAGIIASFEVRRDGEPAGLLVAVGSRELSRFQARTLLELADRVSVAVTNTNRADALYRQANFDALTGLINRKAFTDRLKETLASAGDRGQRAALLFLDLDRFKHVNDTQGHVVGDELLRVIGERLHGALREADVVARLGGDEFAVILPELHREQQLRDLCGRLMAAVCEPARLAGAVHTAEVSIGVAIFPDDGADADSLLKNADVAMYQAKEQRGSSFAFFDESLNRATERRVRVEARLRSVIAEERLELHFQPQLNLRTGRIEQAEGLLRWPTSDPDRLSPAEFIPVAEDTGLIHQLSAMLVRSSAACLERCDSLGLGLQRVAINVSSQLFTRPGLANLLLDELAATDLQADRLEVEITESVFIDQPELVRTELKKLRAAGVRVALDDFGTGYSSLNMLQTLPLDMIKIDQSFVAPLVASSTARQLAEKIIQLARVLNLEVVAEGVETQAELDVLRSIGCDLVQGFLLSPAVGLDQLVGLLRAQSDAGSPAKHPSVVPLRR